MALLTCDFFSESLGCGTGEGLLLPANERMASEARELGLDVTTDFRPGAHEWGLWDAQIQDVLAWLGSSR